MATNVGIVARNQRAERRSTERAKQQATSTVNTDDGGTVALETEETRGVSGDTPMGAASGMSVTIGGNNGGHPAGDDSQSSGTGGNDGGPTEPTATTVDAPQVDKEASSPVVTAETRHLLRVVERLEEHRYNQAAPCTAGGTDDGDDDAECCGRSGATADRGPRVPEAPKADQVQGAGRPIPVPMWLKTVRAEWTDAQLYHEVALNLDGEAQR
ncbi:hypothetical protein PHYSODRAFT_252072 [Phytophthora sojae]|uniref:Uncharacterized protein n=1 Tax=Phytophthora sojae (strain P6497) TaxID=1094619 RepID=G4YFC9_PHYSP|nr:hypothetical protein PHYSODRAFT_252072 [Phytophthora sojae]EGZ28355.1 hypothetical protein PHYSODRAFT_252072 [Phytophthora sojae]|eukprot:XP_009515630.1 hypothetical protein PHYSODRAFT_252072 [Phytophthora sojae]